MDFPTVPQALLYVGVLSPPFLAGFTMSASSLSVPAVKSLATPGLQAQTWRAMYRTGAQIGPPLGLSSAAILAFNAWQSTTSEKMWLFGGAALLAMANAPHTLIFMMPTNNAIEKVAAKADKKEDVSKAEMESLLVKWTTLNYIRGVYGLAAGALALYATRL